MAKLQLYCKRAKIFRRQTGDASRGEEVVQIPPLTNVTVPGWVKSTLGYELGVKDKSIVDLTPQPKPALDLTVGTEDEDDKTYAKEPEDGDDDGDAPSEKELEAAAIANGPAGRAPKGIVTAGGTIKNTKR